MPEPFLPGSRLLSSFVAPTEGQDQGPALARALAWSEANDLPVVVDAARFVIATPVRVATTDNHHGEHWGIRGLGGTFRSQIADGSPVITVEARHYARGFRATGFALKGNGRKDGDGLVLTGRLPGHSGALFNWLVADVTVEGVGGSGFAAVGESFEATLSGVFARDCGRHGALFAHGVDGDGKTTRGICSSITLYGAHFVENEGRGISCERNAVDVSMIGGDLIANGGEGAYFSNGTILGGGISDVHCENNCRLTGRAHILSPTRVAAERVSGRISDIPNHPRYPAGGGGAYYLVETYAVDRCLLIGCANGGDGTRKGKTKLARLSGTDRGVLATINCSGAVEVTAQARHVELF